MTDSGQKRFGLANSISRRGFIGKSLIGSLATGIAHGTAPLNMSGPFLEAGSNQIELKVIGDEREGYGVTLTYRGQPAAGHNAGGEFSGSRADAR